MNSTGGSIFVRRYIHTVNKKNHKIPHWPFTEEQSYYVSWDICLPRPNLKAYCTTEVT